MSNHPQLESLIQSMSGAEKRYFKMNAPTNRKKGTGQFMKLYDAMVNGRELNKKAGENRAATVGYLYNSILQCLDTFHEKNSVEFKLDRMIRSGVLLFNRGLYKQSMKMLMKAESAAIDQEDYARLQIIYPHLKSLLGIKTDYGSQTIQISQVLDRTLKASEELHLQARLRFIQIKFQQSVAETANITEELVEELNTLVNSTAMNEVGEESSFFSKVTASQIWSQYYMLTNDNEAGLIHGKKVFDLCYSGGELMRDHGKLLVASAHNYMMRCMRARRFDEMLRVLGQLDERSFKDLRVEVVKLETYFSNLLSYYIVSKRFDDDQVLTKADVAVTDSGEKMNQNFLMFIFTLCSIFALYKGELRSAVTWINRFLNHENRHSFAKNLSVAFDFRLLIYYEQGKMDLLETLLKSNDGKEVGFNDFPQVRSIIRDFLLKEVEGSTNKKRNVKAFLKSLSALKKSGQEPAAFDFFPFDEWVSSKLAE